VGLGSPNVSHINFRDSKLTRILQPSLSGNARMAVICCATPSEMYLEETRSTLQFAARAKLVKTNAQVNEVLDDQSLIRRLQRELAEARRQGGGRANTQHVKALEEKAATAGSEARKLEEKLRRLQASILNNGVLFNEKSMNDDMEKKKRRLSDPGGRSLENVASASVVVPGTVPRPLKKRKVPTVKPISIQSELALLRSALSSKRTIQDSLNEKVGELLRVLERKETDVVAAKSANEILTTERDEAKGQSTVLATQVESLRSEIVSLRTSYDQKLLESEAKASKALSSLETELKDRKVLEDTVDALQDEKSSLENEISCNKSEYEETLKELSTKNDVLARQNQVLEEDKSGLERELASAKNLAAGTKTEMEKVYSEFDKLNEERVRSAFDLAEMKSVNEKILQESTKDKDHHRDLNGKIEMLTTTLRETQQELDAAMTSVDEISSAKRDIEKDLEQTRVSWEESKNEVSRLTEVEHRMTDKISTLTAEIEKLKEQNLESLSQLDKKEDEFLGVKKFSESLQSQCEDFERQHSEHQEEIRILSETLATTKSICKETENDLMDAQRKLQTRDEDFEQESERNRSLHASLEELKKNFSTVEMDLVSKTKELASCRESLMSLEEARCVAEANVLEYDRLLQEASASLSEKTLKLTETLEQIDILSGQIGEKTEQLDSTVTCWERCKLHLEEAQQKINERESTIETLRHENDELVKIQAESRRAAEKEQRDMEIALEELKKKLAESETRANTCEKEMDRQVAILRKDIESANEDIFGQKKLVAQVQAEADQLRQTLSTMKSFEEQLIAATAAREEAMSRFENLEGTLRNCEQEVDLLSREKADLLLGVSTLQGKLNTSTAEVKDLETKKEEDLNKILRLESELVDAKKELVDLRGDLTRTSDELRSRKDELLTTHELLETTRKRADDSKRDVDDLKDDLESKRVMLSESEARLAEKSQQVADLQKSVETLMQQSVESSSVQDKLLSLENENLDLKQLLVDANNSVDIARREEARVRNILSKTENDVRRLQIERDDLEQQLSTRASGSESPELQNDLENLQRRCSSLEELLEKERTDRGEEQRDLIRQGEDTMRDIIKDLEVKTTALQREEKESYLLRQRNQELLDKVAEVSRDLAEMRKKASKLQSQNTEGNAETLRSLRESVSDLENRLREEKRQKKELEAALDETETRLSELRSQDHPNEILEQKFEKVHEERNELVKKVDSLKRRIKKLETTKLTNEQLEGIRNMKVRNILGRPFITQYSTNSFLGFLSLKVELAQFKNTSSKLEQENERLRTDLAKFKADDSNDRGDLEISKLRFANEANEKQLRKLRTKTQELEQVISEGLEVLRTRLGHGRQSVDRTQFIASLTTFSDELVELREKCEASSKASKTLSVEVVERWENEKRSLCSDIDELKIREQVLQHEVKRLESSLENAEATYRRKITRLENENVKFYEERKQWKKEIIELKSGRESSRRDDKRLPSDLEKKMTRSRAKPPLGSSTLPLSNSKMSLSGSKRRSSDQPDSVTRPFKVPSLSGTPDKENATGF